MKAKHLVIEGLVQGVGYRAWAVKEARRLGLSGWVRNRSVGGVELLLSGDVIAVEEMVRNCRRGSRAARVDSIDEHLAEPPDQAGFHRRQTV